MVTRSFNIMNTKLLIDFLKKDVESSAKINVIGDSLFDEYYDVSVDRISPEFPIPVYRSNSFDTASGIVPGGAANVAYQFNNFNVKVEFISLVSSFAKIIYESRDISTKYCKVVENIVIPTKRRIYSENVPLVRWDIEKENYGLEDIKKHLMDLEIPASDWNIFSDYGKGLFVTPWFRKYFSKSGSIVDPKGSNIDLWEDCTVFKPNAKEARDLSEKKTWKDQVDFFINSIRCDSVLITQSGDGVVGKDKNYFEFKPENKIARAESVVGAGDCFAAFLSMALARGFELKQAAEIAFAAGSCYVMKKMNTPVSPSELLEYYNIKVIDCPELLAKRNYKLVVTNGCFDLLHPGHLESLKFAKKQGDKLCVVINTDRSVKELKGSDRPIQPLEDRIKMLHSLNCVDFIVPFDESTPEQAYRKMNPDVLVKGEQYKGSVVVGSDFIKEVKLAPMVQGMSTSDIIKKIIDNN